MWFGLLLFTRNCCLFMVTDFVVFGCFVLYCFRVKLLIVYNDTVVSVLLISLNAVLAICLAVCLLF